VLPFTCDGDSILEIGLTTRRDGFISIEVSPYLAMQTHETIEEARRLWRNIGRRNLMVKVPATKPGLPAIRALIGEGINVNITLLFSQKVYAEVADAYISGLEDLVAKGGDPHKVASVASFFVSRIDTLVDEALDKKIAATADPAAKQRLAGLKGKVAIANAKLAYRLYQQLFSDERWQRLAQSGAQTQRLLWASTGTKNPAYSDVLYIEELIGADTVNTIPPATMDAFRDHGRLRNSLEEDVAGAQAVMDGFNVSTMAEAARHGDIFCTATGDKNVIRREHFGLMKDGAILSNTGHFNVEIEIPALQEMATAVTVVRPMVEQFEMPDGRRLFLLAEGRLVNLAAAEGHPASVMDMSFANQALSAEWAVKNHADLEPKVYVVPTDLDNEVARLKLASMGVEIDSLTAEQEKYLASWDEGT